MSFNEQLPEWNATGAEPPQSKKDVGWSAEEKPPADWFNWFFHRMYKVAQELQSGAETPAGAQAKADAAEAAANSYTDQQVGTISLTADNVSVADSAGNFTATDVEGVLAELKQYANDGKQGIVTALIGVGQSTAQVTMTFAQLAALIEAIANFDASKLLAGTTVAGKPGTMEDFAGDEITVAWHNHAFEIYPDPNDNRMGFIEIPNLQGGGHTGRVSPTTKFVAQLWGLLPENIAAGKYIGQYDGYGPGQVYGTFSADATAAAVYILAGYTAYVNGVKITGTMPVAPSYPNNNTALDVHVHAGKVNSRHNVFMKPPLGYYDGGADSWVGADVPGLIPANIKEGVVIGGGTSITGTLKLGNKTQLQPYELGSGAATHFQNPNGWDGYLYWFYVNGSNQVVRRQVNPTSGATVSEAVVGNLTGTPSSGGTTAFKQWFDGEFFYCSIADSYYDVFDFNGTYMGQFANTSNSAWRCGAHYPTGMSVTHLSSSPNIDIRNMAGTVLATITLGTAAGSTGIVGIADDAAIIYNTTNFVYRVYKPGAVLGVALDINSMLKWLSKLTMREDAIA